MIYIYLIYVKNEEILQKIKIMQDNTIINSKKCKRKLKKSKNVVAVKGKI